MTLPLSLQRWWKRISPLHLSMLLAALTFCLYLPTLRDGFVSIDDGLLITQNPAVAELSPASVRYVFTSYDPELYIPLTFVSFQAEHALAGFRPVVYHFDNILLHCAAVMLVFAAAYVLSGKRKMAALVCALLFAIHPLQVEAVAWAAARKDLLSSFFFFASLLSWLHPWRERFNRWWVLSFVLFCLGLLSKVTVLTLPLILLLIGLRERKPWKELLWPLAPFFGVSIVFALIALGGKSASLGILTPVQQLLLLCKSLLFLLGKIVFPVPLSLLYQQRSPVTLLSPEFFMPVAFAALLIASAWVLRRRCPWWGFCVLFFLLTFLPTAGTFAKLHYIFFASDRYGYIPSFAVFFLAGLGAQWLLSRTDGWRRLALLIPPVLLCAAVLTVLQQRVWLSSVTLFAHAAAADPSSSFAYTNLGAALDAGKDITGAEADLQTAVRLDASNPAAAAKLGALYHEEGDDAHAQPLLAAGVQAAERQPVLAMEDLAPYYFLGDFLFDQNKIDDGLGVYGRAAERAAAFAEARYNLGLKEEKYNRTDQAAEQYAEAIKLDPSYVPALYRLAALLAAQGKLPDAGALLQRVVQLNPGYEQARKHLQDIERIVDLSGR